VQNTEGCLVWHVYKGNMVLGGRTQIVGQALGLEHVHEGHQVDLAFLMMMCKMFINNRKS